MLTINPAKRITAHEALKHPWVCVSRPARGPWVPSLPLVVPPGLLGAARPGVWHPLGVASVSGKVGAPGRGGPVLHVKGWSVEADQGACVGDTAASGERRVRVGGADRW